MSTCKQCGMILNENNVFCIKCGMKIETDNTLQINYYDNEIELNKINNINDIDGNRLRTIEVTFKELLQKNGYEDKYSKALKNVFLEEYKKGKEELENIKENTFNKQDALYEACKICKFIDCDESTYGCYIDDDKKKYLNKNELNIVEKYNKKLEEIWKIRDVEIHNLALDFRERLSIGSNLNNIISKVEQEYIRLEKKQEIDKIQKKIDERNYKLRHIRAIFKNPTIVAGIVMYILTVICFWELYSGWTLLLAPIIMLVLYICSGITDIAGEQLYGDKWNNMTQHEKEMQIKKDTIINDMYNKKK